MPIVYIGLGSNLGEKKKNMERALSELEKRRLGRVLRRSKIYESAPVGEGLSGDFLNQVVELMTEIEPRPLLSALKKIERDLGRNGRAGPPAPRVIDLDILLYDSIVLNEKDLIIPHPRLPERMFVLMPLNDIKPDVFHPVLQKSIGEILGGAPAALAGQRIKAL